MWLDGVRGMGWLGIDWSWNGLVLGMEWIVPGMVVPQSEDMVQPIGAGDMPSAMPPKNIQNE